MSKQLRIEKMEGSTLVKIAWTGGGEIPDALKGGYTSQTEAKAAIARWLAANPEKEVELVKEEGQKEKAPKAKVPMESLR